MSCFPHLSASVPGKAHGCMQIGESVVCRNCDICPTNPVTGDVIDPDNPCCRQGTFFYYNECCLRGNAQSLLDFSYWVPSDDGSFDGTINGGRIGEEVKHVGLVERRMYNGACNFDHQSSLDKILMTFPDYFLTHFQGRNGWNYITDSNISWNSINNFNRILRARTISLILDTDNLTHVSDVIDSTNADISIFLGRAEYLCSIIVILFVLPTFANSYFSLHLIQNYLIFFLRIHPYH